MLRQLDMESLSLNSPYTDQRLVKISELDLKSEVEIWLDMIPNPGLFGIFFQKSQFKNPGVF